MNTLIEHVENQRVTAFSTEGNDAVILSISSYPLGSWTVITPDQAIDLATQLIATANSIQMKKAA